MGLAQPSVVYGSTDPIVMQFAALANREGIDLAKRHQWGPITKAVTFTTVATQLQTAFLPSDFDRFCDDSMWNTSIARKVYGPLTEQEWQQYQAFPIFTTVNPAFIIRQNQFYLQPAPAAGQTLSYSYVSTQWCQSGPAPISPPDNPQTLFAADTDIALIPETLMTLGIIWRFKKSKGFDYAEDFRTYNQQVDQTTARDGGSPKLNLAYGLNRFQPYPYNIPEGNWP